MNANVFQRSGETWNNISLILSTGNPNDNATPSELQPWMLGFYDPSVSVRGKTVQGTYMGRVTDKENQPIIGATVRIKSAGNAAVTDENGFFKIQTNSPAASIEISSVGFETKTVQARSGYFTIALEQSAYALNEVVVVGYGVADGLQGSVSGVEVSSQARKKEKIQTVAVTTQFQQTTMVYRIDEKYSLETDGKTTTIGIKEFDVPALYDYNTIPKLDPGVFLTAKIPNWQDYDLQSGEVSLYFEGSYLGKTYLDLGTVTDTVSLSLGKDNGIRVNRKLVKEFSARKFIGSSRTETKDYEVSLRNNKKVAVTVRILDEVPVSTNKEISVDDIKAPDGQLDKDSGIVTWMITLQPGQEKKLSLRYSVKYPKDRKVVLE
jgi:hypothetical protein